MPRPASAQTIAVGVETSITRSFPNSAGVYVNTPFRTTQARRYWINRSDCLGGEQLTFQVTLSGYQNLYLQVWAGATDCSAPAQRLASGTAQCWEVFNYPFTSVPTSATVPVPIFGRNIVAQALPNSTDTSAITEASASVCDNSALLQQQIALYFMLVDTAGNLHGSAVAWQARRSNRGWGSTSRLRRRRRRSRSPVVKASFTRAGQRRPRTTRTATISTATLHPARLRTVEAFRGSPRRRPLSERSPPHCSTRPFLRPVERPAQVERRAPVEPPEPSGEAAARPLAGAAARIRRSRRHGHWRRRRHGSRRSRRRRHHLW